MLVLTGPMNNHDVHITNDTTKILVKFQISHDCDDFANLHNKIKSFDKNPASVSIAIETNKGMLVNDLLRTGCIVYATNPKAVNRFKERHVLSKAKSDSIDAEALTNISSAFLKKHKYTHPQEKKRSCGKK